jgi:cytochrome c-type biogenesis protein CcmH/NrfF
MSQVAYVSLFFAGVFGGRIFFSDPAQMYTATIWFYIPLIVCVLIAAWCLKKAARLRSQQMALFLAEIADKRLSVK